MISHEFTNSTTIPFSIRLASRNQLSVPGLSLVIRCPHIWLLDPGDNHSRFGSENLTRPCVREAIDTYFKLSRMSSEEVLIELTKLARGDSKDKLRSLALLSSYHGLLDGAGRTLSREPVETHVRYHKQIEEAVQQVYGDMNGEIDTFNKRVDASEALHEQQWQAVLDRYRDSPVAVEALVFLRDVIFGKATIEIPETEPQVQVIPPQRRLAPAPIERMMRDLESNTREPLSHSPEAAPGSNVTIEKPNGSEEWIEFQGSSGTVRLTLDDTLRGSRLNREL
jgi:hypothetical protein